MLTDNDARTMAFTVYPFWKGMGGEEGARSSLLQYGQRVAEQRGWRCAGVTLTYEGRDDRGERYVGVVDFRPAAAL